MFPSHLQTLFLRHSYRIPKLRKIPRRRKRQRDIYRAPFREASLAFRQKIPRHQFTGSLSDPVLAEDAFTAFKERLILDETTKLLPEAKDDRPSSLGGQPRPRN